MRKPEGDIENSEVVSRKDFERLASQIDSASESAKYARSLAEKILTKEAWQLGLVTLIIAAAAGISGYSVYDKSVEVKSTTNIRGRIHQIHGLTQLENPDNGPLYLFSVNLREENGAINNLPGLIESCRKHLIGSEEGLAYFENALAPWDAVRDTRLFFKIG